MPVVTKEDISLINLFNRCRTYKVLPQVGSLMDQDNEIIELFDVMQGCINAKRAKDIEEQKLNLEKERMKRELPK
jgi:hypothetical protein